MARPRFVVTPNMLRAVMDAGGVLAFAQAVAEDQTETIKHLVSTPGPPRSSPGEPPHKDTGAYHDGWETVDAHIQGDRIIAGSANGVRTEDGKHLLGRLLERGTERMAPRPHIRVARAEVSQRWLQWLSSHG